MKPLFTITSILYLKSVRKQTKKQRFENHCFHSRVNYRVNGADVQTLSPCIYQLFSTGDERIELPLRVLETPVMPFDQSPIHKVLVYITISCVNCQHFFVIFSCGLIADSMPMTSFQLCNKTDTVA